ncbi:MAG: hypothetical protein E6G89_00210 [Alphaproteobacteria bacterium]|nr:MAG: hypothetical protein E6G89_00210 [Alphaproteobacteria bacterium]
MAGVIFAGIQAFGPTSGSAPINVTVAVDPAKTGPQANLDVSMPEPRATSPPQRCRKPQPRWRHSI